MLTLRDLVAVTQFEEGLAQVGAPTRLCGQYVGDNDGTCPQLTCVRRKGHDGLCDNVRGDDEAGGAAAPR